MRSQGLPNTLCSQPESFDQDEATFTQHDHETTTSQEPCGCREEAGEAAGGHSAPGDIMETPVTGVLALLWSRMSAQVERETERERERETERQRDRESAL